MARSLKDGQRLLLLASSFPPSLGGVETVAQNIAETLSAAGYAVTVATRAGSPCADVAQFATVRNPSWMELLRLHRESALVIHMNLTLQAAWPLLLHRRPLVIVHNGFYRRASGRLGFRDRLKRYLTRFATNIACSSAVASDIPSPCTVILNAYDERVFVSSRETPRDLDLLFVGRLVSEKGVDVLLDSLAIVARAGEAPSLTIVGEGPDEPRLKRLSAKYGIDDRVRFTGPARGHDLALIMRRHKVMVVPSRNEGFGVVALEGIASGCLVVASDVGGLPEAVGDCGLTFRCGDPEDLARALRQARSDANILARFRSAQPGHLAMFSREAVGGRYISAISAALSRAERS